MPVPGGTVFRIARYAVHDGPGIRTTVFLKGCPLRCSWCHSPESQKRGPELLVHPDRCARCGECLAVCPQRAVERVGDRFLPGSSCTACGTCVGHCPHGARQLVGTEMTVGQVLREIEKDRLFYEDSCGGVTFSGGEPLLQAAFLGALVDACRACDIHTAVDTSGYAAPHVIATIRPDLFLYDLKVMDEQRHKTATGVSNQPVLANLAALTGAGAKLRLRFPLVPGVNDDESNVRALGRHVKALGYTTIDLLPYHRAGLAKYARLNRSLPDTPEPSEADIVRVRDVLSGCGVAVHIGG